MGKNITGFGRGHEIFSEKTLRVKFPFQRYIDCHVLKEIIFQGHLP